LITSSGLDYKVKIEATDATSQLTLLRTTSQPVGVTYVHVADRSDGEKGIILAVIPNQVLRAELTGREKIGIDQRTKRTFPIQEVRIEQPALQMGGALLFSKNGRLIGGFFAALAQEQSNQIQGRNSERVSFADVAKEFQKKIPLSNPQNFSSRNLGPQGLVVGYTPTWEVTSRAVLGFLTPGKKAQYGVLGVYIFDNKFGGVEIESLKKGSSADEAGLQVGDVILDINGSTVQNQMDFSRATYRMIPGTEILVKVRRKIEIITFKVLVGSQLEQLNGHLQLSTAQSGYLEIR
jgi:S1-C subfamily serine protease